MEHIETIGKNGLRLVVSDTHTFGTDAMLLADFSLPKKGQKACDFGTGCGIIPFYWLRETAPAQLWAVEIQPAACEQLRRSIALSEGAGDIQVINADLRALRGIIPAGSLDVISMNPPYVAAQRGLQSPDDARRVARSEEVCTFAECCTAAASLLKFGGKFCVCLRPERLADAICALRAAKLEPKRLRFVSQRAGSAPWLFLLDARLGRNPGLTVLPELTIEAPDGSPGKELLRVLGSYRDTPADA